MSDSDPHDAIRSAMATLLDRAQQTLAFPTSTPPSAGNDNPPPTPVPASQALSYALSTHLYAHLATDWQLLPNLTLNSVTLTLDGYIGPTALSRSLSASLTATATLADCLIKVTGTIPELRAGVPTEFTLALRVQSAAEMATPEDIAAALLGPLPLAGVDDEVLGGLRDPSATAWALRASLTVVRAPGGADYWVKEVKIGVAARVEWAPIESLTVTDAAVEVKARRRGAEAAWEWEAGLAGRMLIGPAVADVGVGIDMGAKGGGAAVVKVRVQGRRGVSPRALIDAVVGEKVDSGGVAEAPPGIPSVEECLEKTMAAVEAEVRIEKDAGGSGSGSGSGWGLKSVSVRAELTGFEWAVMEGLTVQDIAFALKLARGGRRGTAAVKGGESGESGEGGEGGGDKQQQPEQDPNDNKWRFTGAVGATISLRDGQFLVPITMSYDSKTQIATITGTLPDGGYGQLTALAADPALLTIAPTEQEAKKKIAAGELTYEAPDALSDSAASHPAPESSPLSLTAIDSPTSGKDRSLLLQFTGTTLTRARFTACHNKTWQLTDSLAITNCGVMFDVVSPRDLASRVVSGYIYGTATLGSTTTTLFAFAAGTKSSAGAAFWLGFSVSVEPDGPLGVSPADMIADAQFCGAAAAVLPDSGGWQLGSFPGRPEQALRSVRAKVLAKFKKYAAKEGVDESARKTRLQTVKVHVDIAGGWPIWDGLQLTYACLNVLVSRREGKDEEKEKEKDEAGYDWAAELFGSVGGKGGYRVEFMALAKHGVKGTGLDVSVSLVKSSLAAGGGDKAAVPSPEALTETGVVGNLIPSEEEKAGAIPDTYPLQPSSLVTTTDTALTAYARITKPTDQGFSLESLTFALSTTEPWPITTSPSITLNSAALGLTILNPTTSTRTVAFAASGLLSIATFPPILTTLEFSSAAKQLAFTVTTGAPVTLLSALVDQKPSSMVPDGFPASTNFTLAVLAAKTGNAWGLTKATLDLRAQGPWKLGEHISITRLALIASFSRRAADAAWDRSVAITGTVTVGGGVSVEVTATFDQDPDTLQLVVKQVTAADAARMAGPGAEVIVAGGPEVPRETGVVDWRERRTQATLTIVKSGGAYRVDSVALSVGTEEGWKWEMIQPTLVLQKMYAAVRVDNIIRGATLSLQVHGELSVKKSPSKSGIVTVDLTAAKEKLHLALDMRAAGSKAAGAGSGQEVSATLGGCNITELLYMLTSGAVALDIDVGPRLLTVEMDLKWKKGTMAGTFRGVCEDWNLTKAYPKLGGMESPALTLNVVRRGRLTGILDGRLVVLGARVSMSYELPKGPLRIAGIDVAEVVKLARKLYRMFKNIKGAVETVLKIARAVVTAVKTVVAVGKAVAEALIALGAVAAVVWDLVSVIFSGGSSTGGGSIPARRTTESDEPDKDADHKEGARWIVGGPGRSPGIPSEVVALYIYPLLLQYPHAPGEEPGPPQVHIIPAAIMESKEKQKLEAVPILDVFTPIEGGGWSCAYTRPPTPGDYTIRVGAPGEVTFDDFPCAVTESTSVLGPLSQLKALGPVLSRRGYAHIFPKDTAGWARFGHHAEDSVAFALTLHNENAEQYPDAVPVAVNWLNDAIKLSFDPPRAGRYVLSVTLGGTKIQGSPATVEVQPCGDPTYSVAYGEGLCSGAAGQQTGFSVIVRDQFNDLMGTGGENAACAAFLEHAGQDLELPASVDTASGLVRFEYTRPPHEKEYELRILVNGRPLDMSPVSLKIVSEPAVPTIKQSILTLPLPPYYAGSAKPYMATIEVCDQYGERFRASTGGPATDFAVKLQKLGSEISGTAVELVDHRDGRYDVPLVFEGAGTWAVHCNVPADATHQEGQELITTHEFVVFPPPALTAFRCYGPGLSSGLAGPASFTVRGLDQAGKRFPITEHDKATFEVLLLYHGESAEITVTADNELHVSYTRPPEAENVIAVLRKGKHITGSPFLVATAAASTDPKLCIVTSKYWKVGKLSTALLVVVDNKGLRRFTGGDLVTAKSANNPVVAVVDNGDGTYAIDYYARMPEKGGEAVLEVAVGGVSLADFIPAHRKGTPPTLVVGKGIKVVLAEVVTLRIRETVKDRKYYMGKLVLMADRAILEVVQVGVGAYVDGLRSVTLMLPPTAPVGNYTCKLFIPELQVLPEVPLFALTAEESPRLLTVQLDRLPLYVGTGAAGGGVFTVTITTQRKVDPAKLIVEVIKTEPNMPGELKPRFESLMDESNDKRINVKIFTVIRGAITLGLKYDRTIINPPQDSAWTVYSSDASNTLTRHLTPSADVPSTAWTTKEGSGVKATLTSTLLTFTKDPSAEVDDPQGAEATLKLPSVVTAPGFTVIYDLRWTKITNTPEAILHSPITLADGNPLLLRYADGTVEWATHKPHDGFHRLSLSSVAADGKWRRIMCHYEAGAVTVLEDGILTVKVPQGPATPVEHVRFLAKCPDPVAEVVMEIRGLTTLPTAFHEEPSWRGDAEAVEAVFSQGAEEAGWVVDDNNEWSLISTVFEGGEMRFSVPEEPDVLLDDISHTTRTSRLASGSAFSITQYRFRVAAPIGETGIGDTHIGDTHITLFGGVTIRFSQDTDPRWFMYNCCGNGEYHYITKSNEFPLGGSAERYVVVTLASSDSQITCWENGRFLFKYDKTGGKDAVFNVRMARPWKDTVVVGLTHFRGLVETEEEPSLLDGSGDEDIIF